MLAPWKKIYDKPRQHIKKERHYFANEGLSSKSYSFSTSHVWIWELDSKESWEPKNWCFWTVVLAHSQVPTKPSPTLSSGHSSQATCTPNRRIPCPLPKDSRRPEGFYSLIHEQVCPHSSCVGEQGFSIKGQTVKYFWLCRPDSLCHNHSALPLQHENI